MVKYIPIQELKFPVLVQSSRYECVVLKWMYYDRGVVVTHISKAKRVHTPHKFNSLADNGPTSTLVWDRNRRNVLVPSVLPCAGHAC